MQPSHKVAKNSFWLIIQPLILNILSIAVIGYIARTLGKADYGKFIFTITFVTIFVPLANIGLRPITVREIAKDKKDVELFVGKMFVLRLFLSLSALFAVFISVNMFHYSSAIRVIVYIYSLSIILNAMTAMLADVFQAYEKMEYVAITQFISGAILTVLSVVVLLIGCRLVGLIWVYTLGSFVGLIVSAWYFVRHLFIPNFEIDFDFWKQHLKQGMPFFLPSAIALLGTKIGIILLSKMSGDVSVGIYGAANNLVDKLIVIPDAVCTAIFPSIAALFQTSRGDSAKLFQTYFTYLFALGLPIAVGTTILAKPIILLIYGKDYLSSVIILQILGWWLFFIFINSIQVWTLGAIHCEKKSATFAYISTSSYLIFNLILIPHFSTVGAALSGLFAGFVSFLFLAFNIKRYLIVNTLFKKDNSIALFGASLIMGVIVFLFKDYNVFLSIGSGVIIYISALFGLKIVSLKDLTVLLNGTICKVESF